MLMILYIQSSNRKVCGYCRRKVTRAMELSRYEENREQFFCGQTNQDQDKLTQTLLVQNEAGQWYIR